ncbi:hypothetical protein TNCV_1394081 [Trichonephila clavipes]|nr:hypothetical protein TNCV_1394081 [Trichonephila clavipes]
MNSIAGLLPKITFPPDTLSVNTIDQFDLLRERHVLLLRHPDTLSIVRVQYFVRGGFGGHRSRVSSKHLSLIFRSTGFDSSGVKNGLRCSCKMHVWVSGPTKTPTAVGVRSSDVTVPLVKVLSVPGWRPMKQLVVREHFLRCGGLLRASCAWFSCK